MDLRGERCPYTFIKARLALEEMRLGEILEVWLDFVPAFTRVPASMAVIGQTTIEAVPLEGGGMRIRVRKDAG